MQLYYCPHILAGDTTLPEEEFHHCINVLRHQPGDELHLIDGNGHLILARLEAVSKKNATLSILKVEENFGRRPYHLHLAIAPTKNADRLEWLAEKATEIGLQRLSLLRCRHSERKQLNTDRLRKIILSATKQSLSAFLPYIDELQNFNQFIKCDYGRAQKMIATSPTASYHIKHKLQKSTAIILIGPEGGFSREEELAAIAQGYEAINLGTNRLRTETAGLYAAVAMNMLMG